MHVRKPICLSLTALESRTVPAHLVIQSETVGGVATISGTDPDWNDTLTSAHKEGDYSSTDATSFARHVVIDQIDANGTLGAGSVVEAYVAPEGCSGSIDAVVTVKAVVQADPGDDPQARFPWSAVDGDTGVSPQGTTSITAPGVSISFDHSTKPNTSVPFVLTIGDTLTLTTESQIPISSAGGYGSQSTSVSVSPTPPLSVQAKYDSVTGAADPNGTIFGTYLTGVKLPNVFTVKAAAVPSAKSVSFFIDGGTPKPLVKSLGAKGTTSFNFDMGQLAAKPDGSERVYNLVVKLLDAKGTALNQFAGTIVVNGSYGVDLNVVAVNDSRGPQPVGDLRVLAGVKDGPKLSFIPTITGDVPTFYQEKLALSFFQQGTNTFEKQYAIQNVVAGVGSLQTVSSSDFKDLVADPNQFDYDIVLTPGTNFAETPKAPFRFDQPDNLLVVSLPDWIKKNANGPGAMQFAADDRTAAAFGSGAAGYEFTLRVDKGYDLKLPSTVGTAFATLTQVPGLDDLKGLTNLPSSASLDAGFTVVAPLLLNDNPPVLTADQMSLKAEFFGGKFKKFILPSQRITASVDNLTLSQPTALEVKIDPANPVDLLPALTKATGGPPVISHQFGPWKLSVPFFTVLFAQINGFLQFGATAQASVDELNLYGDMKFGFDDDGTLDLAKTTGTFELDIAADASVTLKVKAGISASALGASVDLASLNAVGTVNLDFAATVAANFDASGLSLDHQNSDATLDVNWSGFSYNADALKGNPGTDTKTSDPLDSGKLSIWNL
jgi:hypothetical protein